MLSVIFWDPNPSPFTIPFINRPIAWYGILFALGFFVGFYLLRSLFMTYCRAHTDWTREVLKKRALLFCERLIIYVTIGTVMGARLGHILFYEKWSDYFFHPMEIVKIWEGGLASHGAVIGIFLGVILFYYRSRKIFPFLSIPRIFDLVVIPALLVGTFIRIGNFINQEILGTVSTLPWAITFGHPIDGSLPIPRHPVQLYEALFYFLSFLVFWSLFSRLLYPRGRITKLVFIAVFTFRFLIEYVKEEQSLLFGSEWITMGQLLSIPMILLGIFIERLGKANQELILDNQKEG